MRIVKPAPDKLPAALGDFDERPRLDLLVRASQHPSKNPRMARRMPSTHLDDRKNVAGFGKSGRFIALSFGHARIIKDDLRFTIDGLTDFRMSAANQFVNRQFVNRQFYLCSSA